jgi:hypothetical protein
VVGSLAKRSRKRDAGGLFDEAAEVVEGGEGWVVAEGVSKGAMVLAHAEALGRGGPPLPLQNENENRNSY